MYKYVIVNARLEKYVEEKLSNFKIKYPFVIRVDTFLKKENRRDDSGHDCDIRLN